MNISNEMRLLGEEAVIALAPAFAKMDRTAEMWTEKILNAFAEFKVSDTMMNGSTGYGYSDHGRDVLDQIYARVFGAEAALVRHQLISGTHALTVGLFGLLRPGNMLIAITGKPYDTLEEVIGITGEPGIGSLRDFGVNYAQIDLTADGGIDKDAIAAAIREHTDKGGVLFIQRSKGYLNRPTLSAAEIGEICAFCRSVPGNENFYIMVDNCYGEFVDDCEPCAVGADLMVGSLIKNPGGGLAECGGYVAGTARAVELAAYRLTSPGIGAEAGASLNQLRSMYRGFFFAPHVTAQALKTAAFAAYVFDKMGCEVSPGAFDDRHDIIQTVQMGTADGLCAFCRGIQASSPVDAFVTPEPWEMPGYSDAVIMAAGAFVQGSSIELSADGPLRPPYTAFLQGGLTFESGKLGILNAATEVKKVM